MALARKTVLITGAAGGIGSALAEAFHAQRYHVFATARTPSKIPKHLAEAPNVTVLTLDVLSSESIAAAVKRVKRETGGKLDVLVNNSGMVLNAACLDASMKDAKEVFDLNFWAVFSMVQAFAPLVIEAKGCIVNNASVTGAIPMAFAGIYNSSKAALILFTETLRLEVAPLGVRTITLMTSGVNTGIQNVRPSPPLPENSYYMGIKDTILGMGAKLQNGSGQDPNQYATKVVREIEKGATGKVWVGASASLAKLASWLMPASMLDKMMEDLNPFSAQLAKSVEK